MSITMYSASVPVFGRMLNNLLTWIDKAEAHAAAKKFDPVVLVTTRLAPDMLPLKNQVQIACDVAKFCIARLADAEAPKFDDGEATLADLRERVKATLAFLESVPAAKIDGTDDKDITVPRRDGAIVMKGEAYLNRFVMPTFFFHVTTMYALLRHNGVEIGKRDYLGALQP